MSDFTLVITPDGHTILTTPKPMSAENARHIRDLFQTWRETPLGSLVVTCDVVQVVSVDLDLDLDDIDAVPATT